MSAMGQKQAFAVQNGMSALFKSDIVSNNLHKQKDRLAAVLS